MRKVEPTKSTPLGIQNVNRSINSAFFSPTGKYLLTTTMTDKLEIIPDFHLQKDEKSKTVQQKFSFLNPKCRIKHNNQTGRWLTTFHARWHPTSTEDLFISGSMLKPRTVQIFNGNEGSLVRNISGEALTAVVSRCCFHPTEEKLIIAGGNSSGRVTIAR